MAVTHPSFDDENNYQELEFIGDGIIKGILSQYIPRRFPKLKSESKKATGEGILSKTRRYLEQRKTLSDFGLKLGFWEYVKANEETKSKLRKETLEDIFEAFVGSIVEIVDNRIKKGLGYVYAYNYVEASLNEIEIEISKETLDDPITRLNELYKANEIAGGKIPLKWGDALYKTEQIYFPKIEEKPLKAERGDAYYSIKDKIVYVYDGKIWITINKAPLIQINPIKVDIIYDVEGKPTNLQMLWYASVYGFPNKLGKISEGIDKIPGKKILENPEIYGAYIIGQGIHFKKAEAKKIAALQGLSFLNNKGYKK
jgi:dsRNA-specific ribonuclease